MVMKILSRLLRPTALTVVTGTSEGYAQSIRLEPAMLRHVQQYRQTTLWSTEAGGQLFGLVDDNTIQIICATGPYVGDERSRYCYRSNPVAAQRAIETQAQAGLLYLGEWHTHAQDYPTASNLDSDAMSRLIANSKLNCNVLLMLIVGRIPSPEGLVILSITPGEIHQWRCSILINQVVKD